MRSFLAWKSDSDHRTGLSHVLLASSNKSGQIYINRRRHAHALRYNQFHDRSGVLVSDVFGIHSSSYVFMSEAAPRKSACRHVQLAGGLVRFDIQILVCQYHNCRRRYIRRGVTSGPRCTLWSAHSGQIVTVRLPSCARPERASSELLAWSNTGIKLSRHFR